MALRLILSQMPMWVKNSSQLAKAPEPALPTPTLLPTRSLTLRMPDPLRTTSCAGAPYRYETASTSVYLRASFFIRPLCPRYTWPE